MIGKEDIESWLIRTELDFEELEEGIWVVRATAGDGGGDEPPVMLSHQAPVLFLRAAIREAPEDPDAQAKLFRRLLELNANDLVHGAYGLEEGEVVLTDTLELETLDFEEFRASLESLTMAVSSHVAELVKD